MQGILLFSSILNINKIEYKSKLEEVTLFCRDTIQEILNKNIDCNTTKIKNTKYYVLRSTNKKLNLEILELILNNSEKLIDKKDIPDFIRGIFIDCGNIYDPKNKYYLEFIKEDKLMLKKLQTTLEVYGFKLKCKIIKEKNIIYTTNSNVIEDFLTYIGATKATLEIINTKIYKSVRNKVNRLINCETYNINKTVLASSHQIKCINRIIKYKGLNYLDEDLKEIALKRKSNPEMSLSELANILSFDISKSSLNYKLKKIESISTKIKKDSIY